MACRIHSVVIKIAILVESPSQSRPQPINAKRSYVNVECHVILSNNTWVRQEVDLPSFPFVVVLEWDLGCIVQ